MPTVDLPSCVEVEEESTKFTIPEDIDEAMELYHKQPIVHKCIQKQISATRAVVDEGGECMLSRFEIRGFLDEYAGQEFEVLIDV